MNAEIAPSNCCPPRILVVDDEQRIRDACRMVLAQEGFDVELAADGSQGLEKIALRHFDIILLDLMMPSMSGLEVLSKVKARHPDTVVIVITGYATLEHSIEAMKRDAFDFIPKPFTPDQLRMVVMKALNHIRTLEDIAQTHSRIRTMVNRLSDGVLCTDSRQHVVLVNPAFLQLMDVATDAVIGQPVAQLIGNEQLLQIIAACASLDVGEQRELNAELTLGNVSDGDTGKTIDARCMPFCDRIGNTIGTITVLHDVTALKQMDRIKSDFVSMVSHEIRSPLNTILMQLQVIADGLAGPVTSRQQQMLSRAGEKIDSLIQMASELLDLSRIESGLILQEREALDLAELIREQTAFFQPKAAAEGIDLSVGELPGPLPVMANRQNMNEVLTNLIANAIKYSRSSDRVTVSGTADGEYVSVVVSDTGLGIDPEEVDHIFKRFYRVKNADTRFIHGSGLGLAIVKSIVAAHQGRIRVDSRPGSGSTFTVVLPQRPA